MDLSDLVSVRKFQDFGVEQKEELYETLLELAEAIEEIPKKSLRKTLDITFAVLRFKGGQIVSLQEQLEAKSQADSLDESHNERLLDENEKLKRMLGKLDEEKQSWKHKVKELTDEILNLQKRLQDAAHSGDVSEKDSSDPLSELDKQEELLKNINAKNKHIKRLLREIEALQTQNIEQSKAIIETEKQLQQAKAKVLQLSADITLVDSERKALKETVNELHVEISRLEGNITYLEEERERGEKDLKDFIEKLETRAQSWKKMLDEKDIELKKLRTRLGDTGNDNLTENSTESDAKSNCEGNVEDTTRETTKLLHAIESRDKLIEQLELKIKTMAEEMLSSTKLMNKLTAERQEEQNLNKPRSCCKLIEESLQAANERCREISEMLERCEEDNELKCKQAMQAITALDAYQRGQDGLVKALRKCASLEQKLKSRDKQIQALVMELNSLHEIAHENLLLRKRLNIPADVVIATKNLAAKERSKDKMIDRLTLKLRASEEIRLQLKMEKADLRSELIQLQKKLQKTSETNADSLKLTSEVGEVEDSTQDEEHAQSVRKTCFCSCQEAKFSEAESDVDTKYQEIIEENDILRVGMLEILEKLREYDATSEHITIDTQILLRLLQALQSRSSSSTAITTSRLQSELQSLKAREKALRELLTKQNALDSTEMDELASVESVREDGEIRLHTTELQIELPSDLIDTSTRPTTPNKTLDQSLFPIIQSMESIAQDILPIEQMRELQIQVSELEVYRQRYEELKLHIGATECELGEYCKDLLERLTELELINTKKSKVYEYLRKDYDQNLTELKRNELKHITTVADFKKKICQLSEKNMDLQNSNEKQTGIQYTTEEFLLLQRQNTELQAQLAYMVEQIFAGKITPELKIHDICTDYGIIRENVQLDYLTMEEYEKLQRTVQDSIDEKSKLERKCVQLEGLLEIANEQILSQQKMLNEIADNHINLRHLVADLQSTTEDKFIMAKIQRDLDSAKNEIINLKFEREQLQQKCADIELDVKSKKLKAAQIKEDFQSKQRYKDTKLKFLQKSIFALKEKYAKFTPLIFLTNFIFAHAKFAKRTTQNDQKRQKIGTANLDLEELITSKLAELTELNDDSQQLIKLVKSETHNKLLEDQLAAMQQTCQSLQQELTEQRLKNASDAEHWKTIEALFGPESNLDKSAKQSAIDAATNTDAPVPAERKLVPEVVGRRSSLIEMADKNMSPINSPDKKSRIKLKTEIGTQTMQIDKNPNTSENTQNVTATKEVSENNDNSKEKQDAIVQTSLEMESLGVQTTENDVEKIEATDKDVKVSTNISNIEQQLKDAKLLAEERAVNLNKTTAELSLANAEINKLRKQLENLNSAAAETSENKVTPKQDDFNQHAGIIEKTILSFHTLLSEKDKSISKYQDLLQTEREQTQSTTTKLNQNIEDLRSTVHNLNYNIKTKDMEILELRTKLETVSVRRNSYEKIDLATGGGNNGEDNGDNSLNEISDEKIEEMFEQADTSPVSGSQLPLITITEDSDMDKEEKQDKEVLKEVPALLKRIKELTDKATYWENTLKVKEEEINLLREKLLLYQEREKSLEHASSPEIEHLRLLLDDKDKHINELMSTLNNFHDDQQRYISDSTNSSADQITKLAADLTRTEATNKIYHTQVEALRRQLTSLTQREKQARELSQSLRSQLIKRPVVSIKTELNARVKNENLQRRIQQLELELEEARAQIQRQHIMIEAKRAKCASEVGLWEKQKRWQQNAEKFKAKFEESECNLQKTRSLLQSARNAVAHLEKDKQVLEVKLARASHSHGGSFGGGAKCCRTPSCPNLHQTGIGVKYTPSESPETYTGASSECSSPAQSAQSCRTHATAAQVHHYYASNENHHGELIEGLKARIELQQRKILAMELEGKGSNALTTELEKQQERFSAIEAQNIRLEARNLQLQLDNDFLRQGDASERLQKRIKHLEDYIIALKEEMAQAEARRQLCKCTGIKISTQTGQAAEQTILSLRNIVEKLRAENKYLKDGRRSTESRSSVDTPTELTRLQQMYTESMEKISSLQIQLNMKAKCAICCNRGKSEARASSDELKFIKEQLIKKTQLLQKAKVLLTRAAAKEKVLKEQLALWKRKCSELQNVPVIDEISE